MSKEKMPAAIEDTLECVEALARIVKENDLGKLQISTESIAGYSVNCDVLIIG